MSFRWGERSDYDAIKQENPKLRGRSFQNAKMKEI